MPISHTIPARAEAVVVDPVLDFDRRSGAVATVAADQMLARIRELQLQVAWILETHAHADHLSAAAYMKDALGCQVATGAGVCEVQVTAAHMFDLEPQFLTDGSQFDRSVERRRSLPRRRRRLLGDRDARSHARLRHLSDRRLRVRRRHAVPAVSRHGALRFSRRQRGRLVRLDPQALPLARRDARAGRSRLPGAAGRCSVLLGRAQRERGERAS